VEKTKKKAKKTKETPMPPEFAAYDWGDSKLTEKQRLFVFYFTWPGQGGFHCAYRAAQNAGYVAKTANASSYKMLRNPEIKKLIQKFESEAKASVHDAAQRFIQEKITRADYSVKDFFEVDDQTTKSGNIRRVFMPKLPEELTDEQLLCIDNIEPTQGGNRIVFADRQKERDSSIALDRVWNGEGQNAGQDVEEIREVIIERVIMRQEKRSKMAKEADYEILNTPIGEGAEEL
jgi:hypothetical protein